MARRPQAGEQLSLDLDADPPWWAVVPVGYDNPAPGCLLVSAWSEVEARAKAGIPIETIMLEDDWDVMCANTRHARTRQRFSVQKRRANCTTPTDSPDQIAGPDRLHK